MPDPCFAPNIFCLYFICQRQKMGARNDPARANISSALFIGLTPLPKFVDLLQLQYSIFDIICQ